MLERHGWEIGRYVVMPDHIHFFATPAADSAKSISATFAKWKEWTAKRILHRLHHPAPLWQREFFDHLLRSHESRSEKWDYIRANPVRAGLVTDAEAWPFAGHIHFE
jgi:REP element-mobilizing transposase RayT